MLNAMLWFMLALVFLWCFSLVVLKEFFLNQLFEGPHSP
jgi:hypothetical protein